MISISLDSMEKTHQAAALADFVQREKKNC